VEETFQSLLSSVYRHIDQQYRIESEHKLGMDAFIAGITGTRPAAAGSRAGYGQ